MVVLDHRDVVQAHPLVGAPAAAHRVLLQGAQPGRRLAGVQDRRAGALERVGPPTGVRGDAGEPADQVQQGPLPRPAAARVGPRRRGQHVAAAHPVAVRRDAARRRPRPTRAARRRPRRTPGGQRQPGDDAVRPGDDLGGADAGLGGDGRGGGDVDVPGPPRSSSRAVRTTAAAAASKEVRASSVTGSTWRGPCAGRRRSSAAARPGVRRLDRAAGGAAGRRWPRQRASSRSGKSERRCPPRVSSRAGRHRGQQLADVAAGWWSPRRRPRGAPPVGRRSRPGQRGQLGRRRAASDSAERTAPAPAVIARWTSVRAVGGDERGRPRRRSRAVVGGSSPAASRAVMSSAIRWAKTRPSSSELDASRLAPCTPVQDTSPHAYRPVERGPAVQVGLDAAAGVVLGGGHRQRLGGRVEAQLAAARRRSTGTGARGTRGRGAGRRGRRGRCRSRASAPRSRGPRRRAARGRPARGRPA